MSAPPPVRTMPRSLMSAESSGGVRSRATRMAFMMTAMHSPSASRISLSSTVMLLGTPSIRLRPLISMVKGLSKKAAFDSAHPGRATFQSASGTSYLYLFNNTSAFEMGVGDNGSLDSGWLESQTQTAFTNTALAGNFLFGDMSQLNIEPSSSVGVFTVTASGAINASLSTTSRGNLSWDQSTSMTYSWDASAPGTGTFLVANGAQGEASCAVISATKFVCIPQTNPAPSVEVIEQ